MDFGIPEITFCTVLFTSKLKIEMKTSNCVNANSLSLLFSPATTFFLPSFESCYLFCNK